MAYNYLGSCEGDSGSPVVRRITDTARERPYYEQEFIVSDGIYCEAKATVFTRVSNRQILTWIQKVKNNSELKIIICFSLLQISNMHYMSVFFRLQIPVLCLWW